jgi:hypothetical protein
MSKILDALKKAKAILSSVKLSQEQLTNGSLIKYDGDQIKKGTTVYLMDSNDDWSVLADGEYATKGGDKFTITDGLVTAADLKAATTDEDTDKKPKKQAQSKDNETGDSENDNGDEGVDEPEGSTFDDFDDEFEDEMSAEAKKPYGDVDYADKGYQKDKRQRYPIDTAEHIKAAWNYINKKKNADQYNAEDLQKVRDAIVAAYKEKIDKAGPPSIAKKTEKDDEELSEDKKKKTEKVKAAKASSNFYKAEVVKSAKKIRADNSIVSPPGAGADLPDDEFDDYDVTDPAVSAVVNISDYIDAKLQPLYQQIWDLQNIVCNLKDLLTTQQTTSSQFKTSLSAVIETVEAIANEPAGDPVEHEVTPFRKPQPAGSKFFKIMQAAKEAEEAAKKK